MKYLSAVLLLCGLSVPTMVLAEIADTTHYYAFDDAAGSSVGDTGGANGVLIGTSTGMGWAGGKSGTALGLDGTDGTGVAIQNAILSGSAGTISVWFKMTDLTDRNIIFSGRSTSDANIFMLLGVDYEGRAQLVFRTDANGVNRKAQVGGILNKNEWYHLVLVASGQSYRVYVNGEERTVSGENIGRWFPDVTNQALSYRIGISEANPLRGSFSGMIDELRIYGRTLTSDEVTALYEAGNVGVPTLPLLMRPRLDFTASAQSVTPGESLALTWVGKEVTTCTASGAWQGVLPPSGTRTEQVGSNAEYRLTCTGVNGTVEQKVQVMVGASSVTAVPVTEVVIGAPASTTLSQFVFTRNLSLGQRGNDVVELQKVLISRGYLGTGLATGYFGGMTKAALVKMQASLGLPHTGFFGPMTRAKFSNQ